MIAAHPERLPTGVRLPEHGLAEERDTGKTERSERVPVRGVDIEGTNGYHEEDDDEFDPHHRRIEARALADPLHEDRREDQRDHDRGQVERRAGGDDAPDRGIVVEWRSRQAVRHVVPEDAYEILKVVRPPVRNGRRDHGVFEHEVPPDDPREQLTHCRVGVSVGRACHRHHRGELRIAECGEDARDAGDDEREDQSRSRIVVRGFSRQDEYSGADDRPDAEASQLDRAEDAAEPVLALHLLEQQSQGFCCQQLSLHASALLAHHR
jgi:hypothetical protein